MPLKLVSNASPLILLSAIGKLEPLHSLAAEVGVPRAVMEEIQAGRSIDSTADQLTALTWISIVDVGEIPTGIAAWDLDAGETAVMTWAAQHEGWTALVDDGCRENLRFRHRNTCPRDTRRHRQI